MDGPVNLLELVAGRDTGPFNQVFMLGAGHRALLTLTTMTGPWHQPSNTPETLSCWRAGAGIQGRVGGHALPRHGAHRSSSVRAVSVSLKMENQQVVLEE